MKLTKEDLQPIKKSIENSEKKFKQIKEDNEKAIKRLKTVENVCLIILALFGLAYVFLGMSI